MSERTQYEVLFERSERNPILTAADWPYPVHTVFNAGATLLPDGTTLLLCRVEDRRGHSHLCAARSADGVGGWVIDAQPTLSPDPENHPGRVSLTVNDESTDRGWMTEHNAVAGSHVIGLGFNELEEVLREGIPSDWFSINVVTA